MPTSYVLVVEFQEDKADLLYEGESWYTERIRDTLRIAQNSITITFNRSGRIDMENYLYSLKCPVRIQLYKAACFYLAVVGNLPPVISARLVCGNRTQELDQRRLTQNWENCRISITLEPEKISRCFGQDGRVCYIALTYFLKAQLDSFPHDCFRAAWSGLNALYHGLSSDNSEKAKLSALAKHLEDHPPKLTQAYIKALPADFWKGIDWYNYIRNRGLREAEKDVFETELYQDETLYSYLARCVIGLYARQEKKDGMGEKAKALNEQFERRLRKKERRINQQAVFLIVSYCYMLRNRSFHADKPYPVFDLFDDDLDNIETTLTRILLLTIKDTIADLSLKERLR